MKVFIDGSYNRKNNISISTVLINYKLYFFEIKNKNIQIYGENIKLNAFQAEFFAFLMFLSIAKKYNLTKENTTIFTDSQALYGILNKIYTAKKSIYYKILQKIRPRERKIEKIDRNYNLADLENIKFIDLQESIEFKFRDFPLPIEIEENISFSDIVLAYKKAKKGKKNRFLKFEENFYENLEILYKQVINKSYINKPYICFIKKQRKYREIFMTEAEDLIIEHLILEKIRYRFEKSFFYDIWNHMLGKGTHKAQEKLKKFIRMCSNNYDKEIYYLKADIKGFFYNINRWILRKLLWKKVKEEQLRYLLDLFLLKEPTEYVNFMYGTNIQKCKKLKRSLFKTPRGKGVPLGNVLSQFFANVYLHQLDFFIKMKLHCKYYIRYADDFIILSESKEELQNIKNEIRNFLKTELDINLSTHKTYIKQARKGIRWLGKKFYYYNKERLLSYHYKNFNEKINQAIKQGKSIKNIINGYKNL